MKENQKIKALNKFLSYIHMGNSTFRIYYNYAKKIGNEELTENIVEAMELFKHHEEVFTNVINETSNASDMLTPTAKMALCVEKMKPLNTTFDVCYHAVKAVNMGYVSVLKFLYEHSKLGQDILGKIVLVINDYNQIREKFEKIIIKISTQN